MIPAERGGAMQSRGRVAAAAWSVVAVVLSSGCAAPQGAVARVVTDGGAPIDLQRMPEPAPAAAQAPTRP